MVEQAKLVLVQAWPRTPASTKRVGLRAQVEGGGG